ncbi:MAG: hypothetical protein L3J43_05130 [Sulfurovum sp.]|nr:hypothetical protein [Sulfurovum sp.]
MYKFVIILFIFLAVGQAKTFDKEVIPVFNKYMKLYSQDNGTNMKNSELLTNYEFKELTEALTIFSKNYCSSPNKRTLDKFIEVLTLTEGSAFESPSTTLGKIYICQPNAIIGKIKSLHEEKKKYILKSLSFGFKNIVYKKEHEVKNYKNLVKQLNNLNKL